MLMFDIILLNYQITSINCGRRKLTEPVYLPTRMSVYVNMS